METIIPQQKKLQKLTKKQRGFVKDYLLLDENGTQAALKNYKINTKHGTKNEYQVAASIATENLNKPYIIEAIEVKRKSLRQALLDKGIDEDYLADKVNVLLTAEKKTFRNNVSTGEIEEIGVEPDFTAIDKGLKHATTIFGIEDPDKPKTLNSTYNFIFNKETQKEILDIDNIIKEKLKQKHELN